MKTINQNSCRPWCRPRRQRVLFFEMATIAILGLLGGSTARAQEPIDFGLQIRPILADKCFHCHGPDESHREANLRLDDEGVAKSKASTAIAIVPSDLEASELWKRIESMDPETVMPPPSTHKSISEEQKELLKRWILEGSSWGAHWSFALPKKTAPPTFEEPHLQQWTSQPVDAFVMKSLVQNGLTHASAANPYNLCRRLYLDLIGLPPTVEESDAFVKSMHDDSARAVDSLVDGLLKRPEFGEHWARMWLDLARYADTKGYEKDLKRDLWPYRDWVINALNDDMPFDQFTTLQLAGDLLENATEQERIATAFHRATLANDEGGTDDEEYRVAAVKDRIDTTIQVWMGLTMGCAKCHTHKYDPISIEDYYQFFAIFNQTEDADRYDDEPRLAIPSYPQQIQLRELTDARVEKVAQWQSVETLIAKEIESRWIYPEVQEATSPNGTVLSIEADKSLIASGLSPEKDEYTLRLSLTPGTYECLRIEAIAAMLDPSATALSVGRSASDPNFVITELQVTLNSPALASNSTSELSTNSLAENPSAAAGLLKFSKARADFEQSGWPAANAVDEKSETGWAIGPQGRQNHWAIFTFENPLQIDQPATLTVKLDQQYGAKLTLLKFRCSVSSQPESALVVGDQLAVTEAFKPISDIDQKIADARSLIPQLPIMREHPASASRKTRVHNRGNFLDQTTEVQPAILKNFVTVDGRTSIASPAASGSKVDRLAVARWLTNPSNSLTPRVMANRVWAQLFGKGLVETEEDFGSQGALPSHPELLDFLAVEFRDSHGWSLKKLIKTIVLSNTYQQAFVLDEQRLQKDPRNVLLSRGPRFRLTAEGVRDQALQIAGLLSKKMGGKPVMPPQPDGLWRSTYNGTLWETSTGEDRYRRGIYTFWKRTTPYPSMETFDATTREVCQIRRISTNTPLQALVTLNDPVYVEASLALAQQMLLATATNDRERIAFGLRRALSRPAQSDEIARLEALLLKAKANFDSDATAANELVKGIAFERSPNVGAQSLAAWTIIANAILNLDELLTRG